MKQLHAQHSLVKGQVLWLAWVASGSISPAPRNTHRHTQTVVGMLAWIQAHLPLQVTIQSPLTRVLVAPARWEMCHSWAGAAGQGSLGQCQGPAGSSRAHVLGRAAQSLDCCESKFPNPAKLINKALLWSTGILPWWGPAAYMYICIYLCDCTYAFMHKYLCAYVCVSVQLGRCIKKIFYLMKQ